MRKIISLLLLISSASVYSSTIWQRKIVNYERNQYKAGFQNWMMTQSDKGWIYSANSNGLLEFDGVNWSLYPVRNKLLRSVKIIDKKIYVGGSTEFGYFEPNERGFLLYKSLSANTKDWGGEVWNIQSGTDKIYFVSDRHVHVYNKKSAELVTINVTSKIDCSALINDVLHIGTPDGVFYMKGTVFLLLSTSALLKNQKLVSILPYESKILVTTAWSGLYLLDKESILKMSSIADDFIAKNQLFCTSVSGTKIVLGSVQNGVFLFDPHEPTYKEAFNIDNGLTNNTALSTFFDKDQNLWLGLDKGLSYIDLKSPKRPLFSIVSPIGTGYCTMEYNGGIYLGTNQALYRLDMDGYHLIKGSEGQIWSMDIIDNTLFSSGDNGILVISPTETYKINIPGTWETHPLKADRNRLIAATYSGLIVIEKVGGRWALSHVIPGFYDSSRGFIEDDESYTFWVALPGRIQKVKFDQTLTKIIDRKSYPLPIRENVIFRKIDNNLVICADDGIYKYSSITDGFDHYTELESMLDGNKYYEYLFVDESKNIWYVSNGLLKMLPYTSGGYKGRTFNWGLSDELISSYENVFLMSDRSAIVAVDNSFVKIDLSRSALEPNPLKVHIKKLTSSQNDSIISYGDARKAITLPYSLNSVRIYFLATDFTHSSDILYTYRLCGVDNEWSAPSSNPLKEYTNLTEGRYVFEVKAYLSGEDPSSSEITTLTFTIRPPWYRSIFAYLVYFLLVMSFFFVLYKKTIGKQKKIIYQKGEELIAQSKRYEEESMMKDQEIYELQNENLKTELKYKTQELNGYILNVIRKNEMLEDVKKNAESISRAIDEDRDQSTIRQKVVRLISQINSNIERDDDFEIFQSNFDIIHQDFFKLLDEKFPGLTRNDKILCAYLNMNMSTKEIAPLLNISVRGVEVNRYRLRKKMNLDRDVNLSDFLNDLK